MVFIRKIKATRQINYPWYTNTNIYFSIATSGYLEIHKEELLIKSHGEFIKIDEIISLSTAHPQGLSPRSGIKIEYLRKSRKGKVYICDYKMFGLAYFSGGNETISAALREYQANQSSNIKNHIHQS